MKHILKYSLSCLLWAVTSVAMVSCSEDDASSNLPAAIYPKSVEMIIPVEKQPFIYIEEKTDAMILPLIKGETVTLGHLISPENITFKEIIWSSSNENIVKVEQNGTITALSAEGIGYSIVQVAPDVFYSGSNIYSTLKVVVVNALKLATSITVNSSVDQIFEGETLQLSASILPEDATYKTVKWTSSDESIATVNEEGLLSGLVPGNVTITAHALDNSGITGSVNITIKHAIWATDVTIDAGQEFAIYEVYPLSFTLEPVNATAATVKWESADPAIATVDSEGNVKTLKTGTVKIIGTTSNGQKSEVAIKILPGFLRKDFSDGTIYPWAVQNNSKASFDGEKMIVTFQDATKYRGDLALVKNDFQDFVPLNVGVYRYFAAKMRIANNLIPTWNGNGCVVLDTNNGRYNQPVGNGNNNYSTYLKNDAAWEWNKPAVYYYDLQTTFGNSGFKYSTTDVVDVINFKFVIADYPKDSSLNNYEVYWIRTFKTLEELKNFVDNE